MPEMPDVITGETITSEWGNDIRDRTIQRYASITERTAEIAAPAPGDLSYLEDTGDVDVYHAGGWRHLGVPAGTLQMLGGGAVPTGWLLCNGSAVSRTTYQALFTQIGTAWGAGDGSTTFNLPDMRGRYPRGVAASGVGTAVGDGFGTDDPASINSGIENQAHVTVKSSSQPSDPNVNVADADHTHPVNFGANALLPASRAVSFIIKT